MNQAVTLFYVLSAATFLVIVSSLGLSVFARKSLASLRALKISGTEVKGKVVGYTPSGGKIRGQNMKYEYLTATGENFQGAQLIPDIWKLPAPAVGTDIAIRYLSERPSFSCPKEFLERRLNGTQNLSKLMRFMPAIQVVFLAVVWGVLYNQKMLQFPWIK